MAGILTRVTRHLTWKIDIWELLITNLILSMLFTYAVNCQDYTASVIDEQMGVGQCL
jgi:hypothetical protein